MAKRGRPPKTGRALVVVGSNKPLAPNREEFEREVSEKLNHQRQSESSPPPQRTVLPPNAFEDAWPKVSRPRPSTQKDVSAGDAFAPPPRPSPPPRPAPQVRALEIVCSKQNKRVLVELTTRNNGLTFEVSNVQKLADGLPSGASDIGFDETEVRHIYGFGLGMCPHCSARLGPIKCSRCNRPYCDGARTDDLFKCPCGALSRMSAGNFKLSTSALGTAQHPEPRSRRALLFDSSPRRTEG